MKYIVTLMLAMQGGMLVATQGRSPNTLRKVESITSEESVSHLSRSRSNSNKIDNSKSFEYAHILPLKAIEKKLRQRVRSGANKMECFDAENTKLFVAGLLRISAYQERMLSKKRTFNSFKSKYRQVCAHNHSIDLDTLLNNYLEYKAQNK